MHKCRLCLKNTKNGKCIFDSDNIKGSSYAEMINSLTNVKVSKCDGMTDQICLSCRRKTREFWDYKLQVERSYVALQENCLLKRVCFTNIFDIELKKELIDVDFKKSIPVDFTKKLVKNNHELFNYNDTVIKKVPSDENKPLSVIDFLNSIKEEHDVYQDDCTYEVEIDYDPDLGADPEYKQSAAKKKDKNISNKIKGNNQYRTVLQKPIKPVFLADYSLKYRRTKHPLIKEKLLICPYCGKMSKTLKIHLLTHSDVRPFKCEKCSKTFVLKSQLNAHMAAAHGSKVIKCDQCVAIFTTKERLKSHMTTRHSTEKKHVCEVCNKAFKRKTQLVRHTQSVHNFGPKPFKCELCPDTFSSTYGLQHHLRVHTRERPYNCEICTQPYSYKHDFNRHCLKKHGVCFNRRSVFVMNEQVLCQERVLVRDMMLRVNGILKDDKPVNPFEGPQAAMAFDQMLKAIQSGKVVVDLQL